MSRILSALDELKKPSRPDSVFSRTRGVNAPSEKSTAVRKSIFPRNISLMGSTGSIGLSTLQLVRTHPDKFVIRALAARKNTERLIEQALELRPEMVCVFDEDKALEVERRLKS